MFLFLFYKKQLNGFGSTQIQMYDGILMFANSSIIKVVNTMKQFDYQDSIIKAELSIENDSILKFP